MKPMTLALGFFALALLTGFITNWIRHWPGNLTRGTQHIYLIGTILQGGLFGAGIVFLIRSFTTVSP